jgi:hypothetical protein
MIAKQLASILPLNINKKCIAVFMPNCLFTWNAITHSGNPTRYYYVPVNDLVIIKKAIVKLME